MPRNKWPDTFGMGGRMIPEYAVSLHLADISRQIAPGAHAVLVLDGAGFHIANDLEIPGNISLLRLPPYSPAPG